MRNIFRLFKYDLKHLFCNVITIVIVLGLVTMPSLFTFYNVIACWDVFNNTGNLKVAVANVDEGYESDLISLNINVGDTVVSQLRENDQLDWVFTSEDDAIEGTKSGQYYAAVVIPKTFSHDMFSFYTKDTEHAKIIYYTNEKKNAVAPRVTDQGADQVSAQINTAFAETLSDLLLGMTDTLSGIIDSGDENGEIADLSNTIRTAGTEMGSTASLLSTYSALIASAQSLLESSATLLGQAQDAVAVTEDAVQEGKQGAEQIADALKVSTEALEKALKASAESFDGTGELIDQAFNDADQSASDAAIALRTQAAHTQDQINTYKKILESLETIEDNVSEDYKAVVQAAELQLQISIDSLEALEDSLYDAAENVEKNQQQAQADKVEIDAQLAEAKASIQELEDEYNNNLKPALEELAQSLTDAVAALSTQAELLSGVGDDLISSASSLSQQLSRANEQIVASSGDLQEAAGKLGELADAIDEALESGSIDKIREVIGNDPERLAKYVSAPVGVERHAVFAVENFGSAMAPLYTTLALWVGSLLLTVLLNFNVSKEAREYVAASGRKVREHQMFFGRYLVVLFLALLQSTLLALGNAFFVEVQISSLPLFFACYWLASFVFSFFMYTMVSLFANLGKAIGVIMLIVQITGGGGSFPLQLLPSFFEWISPFLPATHVINAMRAAMMGVYQNDFWMQIGFALIFVIPCIVLGFLRPLFAKLINWFVEKVEASKLVS